MKVAISSNRLLALFLFPTFKGGNSPDLMYFGLLLILSDSGKKIMKRIENIIQKKNIKRIIWMTYYYEISNSLLSPSKNNEQATHIIWWLVTRQFTKYLTESDFKTRFLSLQTWSSHPLQPFRVCPRFHLTLRLFVVTKWPNIVTIWSSIQF